MADHNISGGGPVTVWAPGLEQTPQGNGSDTWSNSFSGNGSLYPGYLNNSKAAPLPWAPSISFTGANGRSQTRQVPRSIPAAHWQYFAGPRSDLGSRYHGTDEGYYTSSQPDVQSIHNISSAKSDLGQTGMYSTRDSRHGVSTYLHPAPPLSVASSKDSALPHGRLPCGRSDCELTFGTQSQLKCVPW